MFSLIEVLTIFSIRAYGDAMIKQTKSPSPVEVDTKVDGVDSLPTYDLLDESTVWTPEIERLTHAVVKQIRLDAPSMMVIGRQRIGKSKAIAFLNGILAEEIGYPILILRWSVVDDVNRSNRTFIQDRMRQSGTDAIVHRDLAVLRSRLIDHIRAEAARIGTRRVAFFIDEAHALMDDEYAQLLNLFNEMERYALKPFFLLVGQPELSNVEGRWLAIGNYQNIGRFASHMHEYLGIHLDDVASVLTVFDEDINGTDICISKNVSLKAFEEGWRIADMAPLIVNSVRSVALMQNITESVRMPMQYLRGQLLAMLYHIGQQKIDPRQLSQAVVIDCLRSTNFTPVLQHYRDTRDVKSK